MESHLPTSVKDMLKKLVAVTKKDSHAELEAKVLMGQILTKDVFDRIADAIEGVTMSTGASNAAPGVPATVVHRATFSYPDGMRVVVEGPESIYKVCTTGSFRSIPLTVERKRKYFDIPGTNTENLSDVLDVPDFKSRFTLRHEQPLRKDFGGTPMDTQSHVRILHRKSWVSIDGIVRIDVSQVKSKKKYHRSFADILQQTPEYEVEVEVVNRDADEEDIYASLLKHVDIILTAYQGSPFILSQTEIQSYRAEFQTKQMSFLKPVSLERQHLRAERENNILKGYTVTVKVDGDRCMLYIAKDKRVLRITKNLEVVWTGLVATDTFIGDVLDGEYLEESNTFFIFDVYRFHGVDTRKHPLFISSDSIEKSPTSSRLGCAVSFVQKDFPTFTKQFTTKPFHIRTKTFVSGNGVEMQSAIRQLLEAEYTYPTDGLVFTPKDTPVPEGRTWSQVYKWKPPQNNTIDFFVRFTNEPSYDSVSNTDVVSGTLYVSMTPGSDIIHPCETMTGEYVEPKVPNELMKSDKTRAPVPFQPSIPRSPSASTILIPLNLSGVPSDMSGRRVESNTIIECVRNVEQGRWKILRTRYDKTYANRVKGEPDFGNDIHVADSIWTSTHDPITESVLKTIVDSPPDDTSEDTLYYRDALEYRDRSMKDVSRFHNSVKDQLYKSVIQRNDSLLELAVGRAGDLYKWKDTHPSLVVGIEFSKGNIESPRQGACVRYLKEKRKRSGYLPPALFIEGDMTQPLYDQSSPYFAILAGREPAPTEYLSTFEKIEKFDVVSCQFAIHYACESEETFREFAKNIQSHCRGKFFGTMMDGQSVYSMLLQKNGISFKTKNQIFGMITKDYADDGVWKEEFGQGITVNLDSFEKPMKEYLVPFQKIVSILREYNFKLVETKTFEDYYSNQQKITLEGDHLVFSKLHRSFVFERTEEKKEEEEEKVPEDEEEEAVVEEEKKEEEEKPKKKRISKKKKEEEEKPEQEVTFFFTGIDATKEFLNSHEASIQINAVTYPTVEHYLQWSKAKLLGDETAAGKIMKAKSAQSAKTLGNKLEDPEKKWDAEQEKVLKVALKAKFSQHPDLRKKLLDTKDAVLAYSDPRDKELGIGTSATTSKAKDIKKWSGKNKLGLMLMDLRRELSEETTA